MQDRPNDEIKATVDTVNYYPVVTQIWQSK